MSNHAKLASVVKELTARSGRLGGISGGVDVVTQVKQSGAAEVLERSFHAWMDERRGIYERIGVSWYGQIERAEFDIPEHPGSGKVRSSTYLQRLPWETKNLFHAPDAKGGQGTCPGLCCLFEGTARYIRPHPVNTPQ